MNQRNIFRRITILAATFLLSFFGAARAYAKEEKTEDMSPRSFLNEIQETISNYVSANTVEKVAMLNSDSVSSNVREDAALRAQALTTMESRIGCVFDRVTVTAEIDSFSRKDNGSIEIQAYEITAIDYHYEDVPDSADFCAIGVWHTIELQKTENGYRIEKDSYDERDVTGAASKDFRENEGNNIISHLYTNDEQNESIHDNDYGSRSVPFTYTAPSIMAAIQYAVTYCGFSPTVRRTGVSDYQNSGSTTAHTSYYNIPTYGVANMNADCANFVSQCLYAAGMPASSQWYYSLYNVYWVEAASLANYLISCGYECKNANSTSAYGNILPGNPVYWLYDDPAQHNGSTGHQMICVGKNSANVPVVCAHTTDVYRLPVNNYFSSSSPLKTIWIATSNMHSLHSYSSSYYSNPYQHHKVCTVCEYRNYIGDHNVSSGICTVCGSSGPFVY